MTEFIYRRALPADRDHLLDFINMVFSIAYEPHNYIERLPKVYAEGRFDNAIHNIALNANGDIRGVVSLMPGTLRVGDAALRTGYVGNVSTHPYGRGEGHMKALMARMKADALSEGMDLVALGGQRQRYGYFGFTPGGLRAVYAVNRSNLRHALADADVQGIDFTPLEGADAALAGAAFDLFDSQPVRMARRREDFSIILRSWRQTPWLILKDGAFAGYLTVSKDGEEIGEILLADMAVLPAALKAWMLSRDVQEVSIPVAPYDRALNRALGAFAEEWQLQVCQKLLVLNFPKVIAALMPLAAARGPMQDGTLSLYVDGAPLTVAVEAGRVSVTGAAPEDAPRLTAAQAQELFFSPFADAARAGLPAGWLPLPLYIAETDCF